MGYLVQEAEVVLRFNYCECHLQFTMCNEFASILKITPTDFVCFRSFLLIGETLWSLQRKDECTVLGLSLQKVST